jgi:hypothetical protein
MRGNLGSAGAGRQCAGGTGSSGGAGYTRASALAVSPQFPWRRGLFARRPTTLIWTRTRRRSIDCLCTKRRFKVLTRLRAIALAGIGIVMSSCLAWGQQTVVPGSQVVLANGTPVRVTPPASPPPGPSSDPYPRIFASGDQAGSQGAWTSTNWKTYAPLYNVLEYSGFVGSAPTSGTYTTVFASIQSASPLPTPPRQGFYLMPTEQSITGAPCRPSCGNQNTFAAWSAQVNANSWWVRASWPSGAIATNDAYSGDLLLNPNNTTTNSAGRNIFQEFAYHFDNYWALGNKDGESSGPPANRYLNFYILDNHFAAPRQSGTWGAPSDTTNYSKTSSQAITYLQKGQALEVAALRAQHPGIVIGGNTNYYNRVLAGNSSLDSSNNGLYDYALCESPEEFAMPDYTATQIFNALITAEAQVSSTGSLVVTNVFNGTGGNGVKWTSGTQSTWGTSQWQVARAWNAMVQMRNWIWGPGPGSGNTLYWFDEEYQGHVHGWLSNGTQRLDPPQTVAWCDGVYRRRFPNGWVLWNPFGNGAQTLTIGSGACQVPSTLSRIANISSSTGDSTINTGKPVNYGGATTVTLQDGGNGDGLFLIGTGM